MTRRTNEQRAGQAPRSTCQAERKATTQKKILDGAVELFGRRGYDRTSITQVAAKAGVSRAAVFWHFGDKAALFREACRHVAVPLRLALEADHADVPPRKRLFELLSLYEDFIGLNQERVRTAIRWLIEAPESVDAFRVELLGLHEAFRKEIEETIFELVDEFEDAPALASGLVSLLDGNMVLGLFDTTSRADENRRRGLRAVAERILASNGSLACPP